jgi:hypothetical protein
MRSAEPKTWNRKRRRVRECPAGELAKPFASRAMLEAATESERPALVESADLLFARGDLASGGGSTSRSLSVRVAS